MADSDNKDNARGNTNTMYIEGLARFVKLVTLPDGERTILKFSLDNLDKKGFHTYVNVEMWNPSGEVNELVNSDDLLLVRGSRRANEWNDKETGDKRKTFFVNAFEIKNAQDSRKGRSSGSNAPAVSKSSDQGSSKRVTETASDASFGGEDPFGSDSPF